MLRSIFGFDWKKSAAHLLLMSKFAEPRESDDFSQSHTWEAVLGEAPMKALQRFLNDGLLEQASLNGLLGYKHKVPELKAMLKQRGLPVSGRKAELIERLIQADSEGMRRAVRGLSVVQCTEKGRAIADEHLAQEKENRRRAEEQTLQALRQRRFKEASRVVAAYEAQQVFARGIGIDWKNHDSANDVAMLEVMVQASPRILGFLTEEQLRHLRLAAGMTHLWGTDRTEGWLPDDFEPNPAMDNDTAARMILFYAYHQRDIAQYRVAGVATVETRAMEDSCTACRRLARKKFKLDELPELPYEGCTSDMGCRCTTTVADF
jgi:hypothetical protein